MFIEVINPDTGMLYKKATQEAKDAYLGKLNDEDVFLIFVENREITDLDWYWKQEVTSELKITMEQLNDYID